MSLPDADNAILSGIARTQQAGQAAEASRNELRLITDAAPLLISYVDTDQCFRFNNRRYEMWFGRPLTEITGKHIREVLGEAAYGRVRKQVEAALSGQAISFEAFMPYHTAQPRHIHIDFIPDKTETGEVRGFVAVVADITERKLAEQERERHLLEIAALNDQLQRAMTETHHRVKNNLQSIAALIELQAGENQGALDAEGTRRLIGHVRTLASVHEVLTHQAKRDGLADTLSVQEVVDQLLPALQIRAAGRQVDFQVDAIDLSTRQGTSLAIIINELVSNAVRHGKGDIQVGVLRQGNDVVLEVADQGPGFPTGFAPRAGAHIGLELAERLARWDLGGQITYANRPEDGAQVTVVFPAL